MNSPAPATSEDPPRFDRKFIEEHQLLERYLEQKLPPKGARELEDWCRKNPQYLDELKLPIRTQSSLKLLEASGRPADLSEVQPPWWKTLYFLVGLGVVTLLSLIAFWALFARYSLLKGELAETTTRLTQGPLTTPATLSNLRLAPDRIAGADTARVSVSRSAPQLLDLRINMEYSRASQFRLTVDKEDQGRALIIENLTKDSNGDLRLSFNSSGLAAGTYKVRIEGLPMRGAPLAEGWLILEVH